MRFLRIGTVNEIFYGRAKMKLYLYFLHLQFTCPWFQKTSAWAAFTAKCMKHGELCSDRQVIYQASSSVRVQKHFLGTWNGGHGFSCMVAIVQGLRKSCCIPKAMVSWERRMWNALTEREVLAALERLRFEIQVHNNTRCRVNSFLIY